MTDLSELIELDVRDRVALITLSDPGRANTISTVFGTL